MKLSVWTYEGPPHIGAMRIATGMRDVHYVLHAPQGDTYADLLFTMIERNGARPPVTYTTFQARDLGSDTAGLFKRTAQAAYDRFQPKAMLVGESCTAELIQDDPGGLTSTMGLPVPVIPLELPAYQRKENWGASETFYQVVRHLVRPRAETSASPSGQAAKPTCNLLGATAYGFRNRDDVTEIRRLLEELGISVNVTAPSGASPDDIAALSEADFNVVLYPEVAEAAARWLEKNFAQPYTRTVPIGVGATNDFVREVCGLAGIDPTAFLSRVHSRLPWYSRSVDSTYFTGKRAFIFGDATHALAAARIARDEFGFEVIGLGTYAREFARDVRRVAKEFGVEPLITDDYLEVEQAIADSQPEIVLGTQMERHIAKRLGLPCAVISAPVHVQDFPARYAPQMGYEGANVIFDTWVHPLMMGLEEHLLAMFREDFEFNDTSPSHLGHATNGAHTAQSDTPEAVSGAADTAAVTSPERPAQENPPTPDAAVTDHATPLAHPDWAPDAEKELKKIPFFVRGKARRNTERYAIERGLPLITLEILYDAKSHFAR